MTGCKLLETWCASVEEVTWLSADMTPTLFKDYVAEPNSWVDKVSQTYRFLSPSPGFYSDSSCLSFTRTSSTEPDALHEVENRRLSSS